MSKWVLIALFSTYFLCAACSEKAISQNMDSGVRADLVKAIKEKQVSLTLKYYASMGSKNRLSNIEKAQPGINEAAIGKAFLEIVIEELERKDFIVSSRSVTVPHRLDIEIGFSYHNSGPFFRRSFIATRWRVRHEDLSLFEIETHRQIFDDIESPVFTGGKMAKRIVIQFINELEYASS